MDHKEKFVGAHAALLLLTAAFLASLVWMALRVEKPELSADGYAVSVEREIPEDAVPPVERVNINTASAEELQTLPGIGPVLAQRIVDYRAVHGAFNAEEELLEVEGIGGAKLDKIRGEITLGKSETP